MPKPPAGSLSSLISWQVSHGRDIGQIISTMQTRFPEASVNRIANLADKYAREYGKSLMPQGIKQLSDRQLAFLAKKGTTRGFVRCLVDATWVSPNDNELKEGSWYIDVPTNLSGSQLQAYALNALYLRFAEQYGGTPATAAAAARFIQSATVRGC